VKHEDEDLLLCTLPNISADLQRGYYPYPLVIEIHPTETCNYRCGYCYSQQKRNIDNLLPKKERVSINRYASMFEEMRSLGINHLSISGGGEPFMDSRILELLRLASNVGLKLRVMTNGSLLSDDAIAE
jgi:MoaA/NifB/PqqE/SkfB family radical SAM enzyme